LFLFLICHFSTSHYGRNIMVTMHNLHPVSPASHDSAAVSVAPAVTATSSNVEALAIATILKDMGAINLTASGIDAIAHVMTQAELNVGYAALLNPALTAGEVNAEIVGLTIYSASTSFGNTAIPIPSVADDAAVVSGAITASILGNGVSPALTIAMTQGAGAVEALAIAYSLHDMGDLNVTAGQITGASSYMSQGQLDVAYAALLNPALTAGQVKTETTLLTLYPASTDFGNDSLSAVSATDAANAVHLIGINGYQTAFGLS
jgi:hypothetical protein